MDKRGFTMKGIHGSLSVEQVACELMRLVSKNRLLHPRDMNPRERRDIQTLLHTVRMTPPEYPHY